MINPVLIEIGRYRMKAFEHLHGETLIEVLIPVAEVFIMMSVYENPEKYGKFAAFLEGKTKPLPGDDFEVITSDTFKEYLRLRANEKDTIASFMLYFMGIDNPLVDNAFKMLNAKHKVVDHEKLQTECANWLGEYFLTVCAMSRKFGSIMKRFEHLDDDTAYTCAYEEFTGLKDRAFLHVTGYSSQEWRKVSKVAEEDMFVPLSERQLELFRQYIEC